jgi:hypothetical protein
MPRFNLSTSSQAERWKNVKGGPVLWRPNRVLVLGGEVGWQERAKLQAKRLTGAFGAKKGQATKDLASELNRGRLPVWSLFLWAYFLLWIILAVLR